MALWETKTIQEFLCPRCCGEGSTRYTVVHTSDCIEESERKKKDAGLTPAEQAVDRAFELNR